MSGWTVLTARANACRDYENAEYNDSDPWQAAADLAASFEADDRVVDWTVGDDHVYAYVGGYTDWNTAERLMADYADMIRDAVVLCANDTSNTGQARYYPNASSDRWTDHYTETEDHDGLTTGKTALAVMTARHGILARDPFHNHVGRLDEHYLEDGTPQFTRTSPENETNTN